MDLIIRECTIPTSEVVCGDLIGKGGFGDVYRGTYRGNDVVLKMLIDAQDASARQRLINELYLLWTARHSDIVLMYGFIDEPQKETIVFKYAKHGALGTFLRGLPEHPPLSITVRMVQQLTNAMAFLHHELDPFMLHRDLKADNILVDEEYNAKLSHFGLSDYRAAVKYRTSRPIFDAARIDDRGTTTHVPPEKFAGQPVKISKTLDIYSYGVTLWEILSRENFSKYLNELEDCKNKIIEGYRPPDASVRHDCPKDLKALMKRCWDGTIKKRPYFEEIKPLLEDMTRKLELAVSQSDRTILQKMVDLKDNSDRTIVAIQVSPEGLPEDQVSNVRGTRQPCGTVDSMRMQPIQDSSPNIAHDEGATSRVHQSTIKLDEDLDTRLSVETKSVDGGRRTVMVLSGNLQTYVHQKLPMIGQDEDLVIPVEIWSQGKAAERAYLDALSAGEPQLRAETVAIVGERGAGKTSIALTLVDGRARIVQAQHNQGQGQLKAQLRNGRQVLVYDLGSHSEHESDFPLFLPSQGIIIIAYDMSEPVQKQLKAVEKWMNMAHARAPEAKLIVIGTKSDRVPSDTIGGNQRQVQSYIEKNFQGAIDEYQYNINRVELASSEDKRQFLQNSLNALEAKRWHLKSLSCAESTGSRSAEELLELLLRVMEPPTVLPHSWNSVMIDFQLQPVLTIKEKEIFFKSCGLSDNVSRVVFQYLVTCQCVVCFEDIIFTQLGKLAELCKNVRSLEETSATKGATNTRGYVSTVDVDKLLKTFTPNMVAAKNLLLHLGVLCNPKGATQLKVQQQLLVPALLGDTASAIKVEQDVVSVHAQFVFSGLILPLLLYERPLAVLQKLDLSKASSKWWRSGFAFRVNEVSITCKWLKHDQDYALDISAASRNIVNLWRELLPLLAGVHALSNAWKGAGYECHIFCPSCELRGRLGRQAHCFDCDLEPTHATTSSQYCQACKIDVPSSLLGVLSEAQGMSKEDEERVRTFLNEQQAGGSTVPTGKSALSSPVRMSLWQQRLRTNRETLVKRMSDVDIVISSLYSRGALTLYEKEKAEAHTARYQKVKALLDTLQIKEDACISQFVQVLNESEQGHLAALFDS